VAKETAHDDLGSPVINGDESVHPRADGHRDAAAPQLTELIQLRGQLEDLRAAVDSIRDGGVDAIMVGEQLDERVYTLSSADRPYRVILDEMGEGAATVSEHGVVLYANRRFAALLGYSPTELVGTDITALVEIDNRAELSRLLTAPAGATVRGELTLLGSDGKLIPALSSATGLDVEGVLVRCLIAADLTERKRSERELSVRGVELEKTNAALAISNVELERSNRELEVYASAISHDLREPLRTTAGFVDLVSVRYAAELPDGARELFGFVTSGIGRMEARIKTILDYARSGAGVAPPHPVDSRAVAEAAVQDVATIVSETGASVQIGALPIIEADPVQLQRVFQNLLTNAVLHRNPELTPVVTINADRLDRHWQFVVADNGPGVPARARERIFNMFSRGPSSTQTEGHGMGLALCRRIVESYGGNIWVEDNLGGGSRFCFTLPAGDGEKVADQEFEKEMTLSLDAEAFRWLFRHSRDGVVFTDLDGKVYAANPTMCAMTGRTEAELRASASLCWVDPTDRGQWDAAVAHRQETGECLVELTLQHSSGTSFPAELSSAIFADSSGRLWASIIVRDISARLAHSAGQNRVAAQVAALRDAHHQADITQRIAVGVNDDIVQSLVAAEMAFDLGELDQARDSLAEASQAARNWVGEMLLAAGQPEPGSLVRNAPPESIPQEAVR
jgi:PAS domain S-box-containing protein